MADEKQTICAICGEYYCSWIDKLKPVKGWTAIPSKLRNSNGIYDDSFIVTKCPLFKKMRSETTSVTSNCKRSEIVKDILELTKRPKSISGILESLKYKNYNEPTVRSTVSYLCSKGTLKAIGKTDSTETTRKSYIYIRSDLI